MCVSALPEPIVVWDPTSPELYFSFEIISSQTTYQMLNNILYVPEMGISTRHSFLLNSVESFAIMEHTFQKKCGVDEVEEMSEDI